MIQQLMDERGMTQTHLGNIVGVRQQYISEIVNGNRSPSTRLIVRLAKAFDMRPGELFDKLVESILEDENASQPQ